MQRILLDANFRQNDDGLRETEGLLQVLADAWQQASPSVEREPAAWMPAPVEAAPRAHNWSA